MLKRISILIAVAAATLPMIRTATALAWPKIPSLHLVVHALQQPVTACTHRIPNSWSETAWAYSNGRQLNPPDGESYFAGHGTLIQMITRPHGGPICAQAITWLPTVHILIAFEVTDIVS